LLAWKEQKVPFSNECTHVEGAHYIGKRWESNRLLTKVINSQTGDYYILPAQLGSRYCGCSVLRAMRLFASDEIGLGVWEMGCILLAHEELLDGDLFVSMHDMIQIDCPGDVCGTDAEHQTGDSPYFYYHPVSGLNLSVRRANIPDINIGAATGFIA
jgi:hypothetical protein